MRDTESYLIMSSTIFIENIKRYLLRYAQELESSNLLGNGGPSIFAEGLFLRIFNIVFDWKLLNGNSLSTNQKGYDLIDPTRKIYIQITANRSFSKKLKDSMLKMSDDTTPEDSLFIVFFIASNIPKRLLLDKNQKGLVCKATDLNWLFKEMIHLCDAGKLEQINTILTSELEPVLIIQRQDLSNIKFENVKQELVLKKSGFYIQRDNLREELFEFCQQGNGLLVGAPGFGKSFLIDAIQCDYYKKNIPCYVIRINELIDGDDDEISKNLGFDGQWLEHLGVIASADLSLKALLIFDALDTAKEERLKARIYKQLRNALKKLASSWTILVGNRTYDVVKSITLQELFPTVQRSGSINCRYMEIPSFSDDEMQKILLSNPKIAHALQDCTQDLKTLLKVPYFVGLLEQIVIYQDDESINLSGITTESQLLKLFWDTKVSGNRDLDFFAYILTKNLSSIPSLVTETYSVVTSENTKDFEELIRQHIIVEHQAHRKHLSFTHNILLEYAISRYLLYDQVDKQINFIRENFQLPFLFRQSFIYFYNELWDYNRDLFWEHYFQIKDIKEPLFRLFHQTVINYIIITSYDTPNELTPLLEVMDDLEYSDSLRKALESFWFINKGNFKPRDVDFLMLLCKRLNPILLWEIGLHLEKAIECYSGQETNENIIKLARASMEYLRYSMKERLVYPNQALIDRSCGYRGISNVCKTFELEPISAKELLSAVLDLLYEEDFPLNYFHTLSECIEDIFKADPQFAAHIYKTIYFHTEQSDKVTSMGSAVLNMKSNRKQDFNINHYSLEQKYKELLKIDFLSAMYIGADIVNRVNEARSYNPDKIKFPIKAGEAKGFLFSSYSYCEEDEQYGPFTHGKVLFESLEKIPATEINYNTLEKWLIEIVGVIEASSLWRKLLSYLTLNASFFPIVAYDLLCNKIFFENDETLYETTALLEALWAHLSQVERRNLEEIIFAQEYPRSFDVDSTWINSRLERILSVIPQETLQLNRTKEFLRNYGTKDNSRIVSSGMQIAEARSLTIQERMAQCGFDETDETDEKQEYIYGLFVIIETFNGFFRNQEEKKITKNLYKQPFKASIELFALAKTKSFKNQLLQHSCDYEIAKFANILSSDSSQLTQKERSFIKDVALNYILEDDYKKDIYETGNMDNHFGGVFSPSARTASVQTLMNILYDYKDPNVQDVVLSLMSDNMVVIRLKSISSLTYFWYADKELFWQQIFARIGVEGDGQCLKSLVTQLCFDNIIKDNPKGIENISLLLSERLGSQECKANNEIWRSYVVLQLKRLLRYDGDSALRVIKKNLNSPEFSKALTFEIRTSLNLFNGDIEYKTRLNKASKFFEILNEILIYRFSSAIELGLSDSNSHTDLEIIDYVVHNIYFTINYEENNNNQKLSAIERKALFNKFLPLLEYIAIKSEELESGFMVAHTGYYFMQILNVLVGIEPKRALDLSATIVVCASKCGFTYDSSTLREIVKLTETLIVDHKKILTVPENFNKLIIILDQFAESGSQEALQLTWSLKEAF